MGVKLEWPPYGSKISVGHHMGIKLVWGTYGGKIRVGHHMGVKLVWGNMGVNNAGATFGSKSKTGNIWE